MLRIKLPALKAARFAFQFFSMSQLGRMMGTPLSVLRGWSPVALLEATCVLMATNWSGEYIAAGISAWRRLRQFAISRGLVSDANGPFYGIVVKSFTDYVHAKATADFRRRNPVARVADARAKGSQARPGVGRGLRLAGNKWHFPIDVSSLAGHSSTKQVKRATSD